jgi:hypothetical protein
MYNIETIKFIYNFMEEIINSHNESFRFDISISHKCYDHKPTSEDYQAMTFHVENLNADDLLDRITSGYSICHIFQDNRRIKKNFMYTNAIFIDVDDHPQPMDAFVYGCELKPTIAYTTISDGKNGLHRFRLIYLLDEQITSVDEYKYLYDIFIQQIGMIETKDNCGSVATQLMNGNSSNQIRVFSSYLIYHTHSFLQNVSLELYNIPPIQHNSNGTFCKTDSNPIEVDSVIKLLNKSSIAFLTEFSDTVLVFQTLLEYNEKGYALFPDKYFRLNVRYDWSTGKPHIMKYRDGEGRRKRLYVDALVIKAIRPDITFIELLYNLVFRRQHYYDNSDGVLQNRLLIEYTNVVIAMSLDEIDARISNSRHGKFSTDSEWCALHNVTRRKYSRTVAKMINYEKIGEWYDAGITVLENLKYANENGLKVSKMTLIRFCKENGINTNPKQRPIREWYDETLSVK